MSPLSLILLLLLSLLPLSTPRNEQEHCGHLLLPFPFHLNSSWGPPNIPSTFHLTCNSSTSSLFLPLGPGPDPDLDLLRILSFLPDSGSLLLDYSSSSSSPCDRRYSGLTHLFETRNTPYFSLTPRNVLRLYDCEDSSVCRTACPSLDDQQNCEGNRGCCYGLADGSVWMVGDGFGVFSEFGCRGFSSWVVMNEDGGRVVKGIEMEWGVPRGVGNVTECAREGGVEVNATAVRGGVRCECGPGFVGDGYAAGTACVKCTVVFIFFFFL